MMECHNTFTGMPPFVVAMEEGRYDLCVDDDGVFVCLWVCLFVGPR